MKGVVALLNDEQRTKFAEQIAEVRKPPGKLPEQKRLLNRGAPRKQFPISAFRPIGSLRLRQGVEYTLTVTNQDTKGFVIVDALQLLPVAASAK